MKKINKIAIISLLSLLFLPSIPISAKEISTEEITKQFLKEKNVTSTSELSREDEMNLFKKVDAIKRAELNSKSKFRSIGFKFSPMHNFFGDIFVTMDNKTSGFRHGHAGIGADEGGSVIEANPGDNVRLYKNRLNGYWLDRTTGGIMRVHGAKEHHYRAVAHYAKRMVDEGKKYGFYPWNMNDFYCSELVYYAWKDAAGFQSLHTVVQV